MAVSDEKYIIYNGDIVIAALREEGYVRDKNHRYIICDDTPITGVISQVAEYLTKFYLAGSKQSIKDWKKDKKSYQLTYEHTYSKKSTVSKNISYLIFAEDLRLQNKFDFDKFNLQPPLCNWLDRTLDVSINYHKFDDETDDIMIMNDGTIAEQYGPNYPLNPRLDREGHIFTTFQIQLLKSIVAQRKKLIEQSGEALRHEWILNLRTLINDCISIVDITLNQLYIKAEYLPESGWQFDKSKLGEKNNRRIKDKIKWVRQITNKPLDIEKDFDKFNTLREVRNHFNHFDPPTIVITLEEATNWLNDMLHIAQILFKIRIATNSPICAPLIELMVQKKAKFNPEKGFEKRKVLDENQAGYHTSTWPKE